MLIYSNFADSNLNMSWEAPFLFFVQKQPENELSF